MPCLVAFDDGSPSVPVASTRRWAAFAAWAGGLPDATYPDLVHLANFGWAPGPDAIGDQVRHAVARFAADDGVTATALALEESLDGADPDTAVMVTQEHAAFSEREDGSDPFRPGLPSLPVIASEADDKPCTRYAMMAAIGKYLSPAQFRLCPELEQDYLDGKISRQVLLAHTPCRDERGRFRSCGGASAGKAKAKGKPGKRANRKAAANATRFVKPAGIGRNYRVVHIDPKKFDPHFKRDKGYYVGKGGKGGIPGRYEEFQRFHATGARIEMPKLEVGADGSASFGNGRHRYAVLRDMGIDSIPVVVHKDQAASVRARFGSEDQPKPKAEPKPKVNPNQSAASAKADEARPSLKEQADAHRASKGTTAERAQALLARTHREFSKVAPTLGTAPSKSQVARSIVLARRHDKLAEKAGLTARNIAPRTSATSRSETAARVKAEETPTRGDSSLAGSSFPVQVHGKVAEIDAAYFQREVDALPEGVKHTLAKAGITIQHPQNITTFRPTMANEKPRGWPEGSTWKNAGGFYQHSDKQVVVMAEHVPLGHEHAVERSIHERVRIMRHEVGHAYDAALREGSIHASQTPEFKAAYHEDIARLPRTEHDRFSYFLQKDYAGPQEAFAETFAHLTGGGNSAVHDMPQHFSRSAEYIRKRLAEPRS